MRRRTDYLAEAARATLQQHDGAAEVGPLNVCDADCKLGQALPQGPFVVRATLPCGFENLVRVERPAFVEQILRKGEELAR